MITHPSVNLAPWNIAGLSISRKCHRLSLQPNAPHRAATGEWYSLAPDLDAIYAREVEDEIRYLGRVYGVGAPSSVLDVRIVPEALRFYAGAI